MIENIKNIITTNFEFQFKEKYEEELSLDVENQYILKRANFGSSSWNDGGLGFGYESFHLELKINIKFEKSKSFNTVSFLNEEGNSIYNINIDDRILNTYMSLNLINLPILVLEDTFIIQFEDN